ncbi:MAG TPA: TIGR03067 domain-containing protein [Humisphaera sp.]
MSLRLRTAALAAALVLLPLARPAAAADAPASAPATAPAKPDQDAIQGTWKVGTMSVDGGEPAPADKEGAMTLKFDGAVVTAKPGNEDKGKPADFKLDATKSPKEIRVTPTEGNEKGKTYNGVYELTGDTLVIAFDAEPGQPTPTDTKPAAKRIVMKLDRQK